MGLFSRSGRFAGHEFISGTVHGEKVSRIGRIWFKFLAQPKNVVINGAGRGVVLISPHLIQKYFKSLNSCAVKLRELFPRAATILVKSTRTSSNARISCWVPVLAGAVDS